VFLLDELEEGGHVRPAKVVDSPQPGEHTSAVEALKVVLDNVLKLKKIFGGKSTCDGHYLLFA